MRSSSTRICPANTITAADAFATFGRLIPIGIAVATLVGRPAAVQAGRAVVRGARVSRPAIEVSGVSKTFRLPHERRTTLKEHFLHPFRPHDVRGAAGARRRELHGRRGRVLRDHRAERQRQEHAAQDPRRDLPAGLRDACASTAGSRRSSSSASASTRSSPRRDNVRINGTLLGLSKRELEERFDEIVAFAGLERFVDQKLKNYSSGMQVRLAYSIAIQVPFDILLLDEVLAVGDEEFQEKCFATFDRFREEGKTIVFVSHDLGSVAKFCERAVWLQDGAHGGDRARRRGRRALRARRVGNGAPLTPYSRGSLYIDEDRSFDLGSRPSARSRHFIR